MIQLVGSFRAAQHFFNEEENFESALQLKRAKFCWIFIYTCKGMFRPCESESEDFLWCLSLIHWSFLLSFDLSRFYSRFCLVWMGPNKCYLFHFGQEKDFFNKLSEWIVFYFILWINRWWLYLLVKLWYCKQLLKSSHETSGEKSINQEVLILLLGKLLLLILRGKRSAA